MSIVTNHLEGPGDRIDIECLLAGHWRHLHHAVAEAVLLVQVSGVHHRNPPSASPGLEHHHSHHTDIFMTSLYTWIVMAG